LKVIVASLKRMRHCRLMKRDRPIMHVNDLPRVAVGDESGYLSKDR